MLNVTDLFPRDFFQIMHSLGFYHEHARSDRDLYIKIVEKNVRPGILFSCSLKKNEKGGGGQGVLQTNNDNFKVILFCNILLLIFSAGKFANFRTMTDRETARNFDYDYNSIMHYGPYFFRF